MARSILLRRLSRLLRQAVLAEMSGAPGPGVPRRRFVQGAGAGLATLSALPLLQACRTSAGSALEAAEAPADQGDVVIVGGGTAGLTTAYRLLKANVKCQVFEASSRLGGRMYTEQAFNAQGMFCERGGELVDSDHQDLIGLCHELGLSLQQIKLVPGAPTTEMFFSKGALRKEADIVAAFAPLAQALVKDQAALTVGGQVTVPTYDSQLAQSPAVQALDKMPLAQYLQASGADPWLVSLIDTAYVGEYGLETQYQSALNLILEIAADTANGFHMLGSSDECFRIQGGNETLPRTLAQQIAPHVPITMGAELRAVADKGTHFDLTFADGSTVPADRVVLAIPVPLLRQVDMSGVALTPVKKQCIAQWGFGTNAKLMLNFSSRIWNPDGTNGGFAVYSDTSSQELWDTSRGQPGTMGIVTSFLGGDAGKTIQPGAVPATLANLELIFPGITPTYSGKSLLQHWPTVPFNQGSYTCPLSGQYTTIYGAFAAPELNGRLLFAGEHCSIDNAGFMDGAVESGNNAAAALLGSEEGALGRAFRRLRRWA